jgi:cyclohexanecarboxylate-CoA ligase
MGFITGQTGARLLVVPSTWRGRDFEAEARKIAAARTDMSVLVADRSLPEGDPAHLPAPPRLTTPADAPIRWVFYTSGTTADPKGAQHSDHTVLASAVGMIEALEIVPDDRSAMVFPFTHIGGIGWLFTMALTGCVGIFVEAFEPKGTVEVLRREDVTLAGAGTPFHMAYLAAQRANAGERLFPQVRACPGGGAPKPPQLHYECKAELGGVGVVSGYGLTEAPILTMNTVRDSDQQLAETEGAATPGVELKVVTLDGKVAGSGEEGEIRAKGPQVFKGYLDSSLDADAFDEEGFFRSGDLGVVEADGHVRITGRLKDIIVRKGENISAKEIEDLLFEHPHVADAAVIGLPDEERGELACAVVVAAETGAPPELSELFEYLKDKGLSVQKIPERLELVDVLPRNPAGKVLKHELRSTYS